MLPKVRWQNTNTDTSTYGIRGLSSILPSSNWSRVSLNALDSHFAGIALWTNITADTLRPSRSHRPNRTTRSHRPRTSGIAFHACHEVRQVPVLLLDPALHEVLLIP